MSKHWNPKESARYRHRAEPRRRRKASGGAGGFTWGEIRLTLLGGLFAGLAYAFVPMGGTAGSGSAGSDVAEFEGAGSAATGGGAGAAVDFRAVTIVDGDTFRYRGEKYRIADIDAPEVKGRCAYEVELAARATDRMEALLHEGPFELHGIDRDEDQYGRKLRIATRGGESLGDRLVAEGLARTWTGRREPWCS